MARKYMHTNTEVIYTQYNSYYSCREQMKRMLDGKYTVIGAQRILRKMYHNPDIIVVAVSYIGIS